MNISVFTNQELFLNDFPLQSYWLDINNVYQGCNNLHAKILNFNSCKDIIGKRNKELPSFKNYPTLAQEIDDNNNKVINSGKPQVFEEKIIVNGFEYIYISQKSPLFDEKKNIIGVASILTNITDYKLNELAKLKNDKDKQLNTQLQRIADIVPFAFYWKDLHHRFLGVNNLALEYVGLAGHPEKIIGKTDYEIWPEKYAKIFVKDDLDLIQTGKTMNKEDEYTDVQGNVKYVHALKAPLYDENDNIKFIIGSSIDVTAKKKVVEQRVLRLEIENEIHQELEKERTRQMGVLNKVFQLLQTERIHLFNYKMTGKDIEFAAENISLTRREREILYFLGQNKSRKEIAACISKIAEKKICAETIGAIINHQLYPKFEVSNEGKLVEKATLLQLIPYVLDNF